MYRVFDHTADLGLQMSAPDLPRLCAEAGRALLAAIVGNPDEVEPAEEQTFDVPGSSPEYLLFDWMGELLDAFERRRMLYSEFRVEVGPRGLHAAARGERLDPQRHHLAHEVKAITYHGLEARETDAGWEGRVIVDI